MEELRRTHGMKALAFAFLVALVALSVASLHPQHSPKSLPDEASVLVRNLSPPGAFEVENRGPDIELARTVTIQRDLKGEWSDESTDLALVEMFKYPTVASLAQYLGQVHQSAPNYEQINERAVRQNAAHRRQKQRNGLR